MDIQIYIQALTLIAIVVTALIALKQLGLLREQIKAQHDWNRRLKSLDYSFSKDPHIRELRSKIDKHLQIHKRRTKEISLEEIEKIENDSYPTIRTDIQFILGRLESMCVAMKDNIVDEKVCKDLLRGIVIMYFRFFRQYIDEIRAIRSNPRIYICLEAYAKKWDENNVTVNSMPAADHKI